MGSDLIFGFSFSLNIKCAVFTLTRKESVCVLDFTVYKADFVYDHALCALIFQTTKPFNSFWDFRVDVGHSWVGGGGWLGCTSPLPSALFWVSVGLLPHVSHSPARADVGHLPNSLTTGQNSLLFISDSSSELAWTKCAFVLHSPTLSILWNHGERMNGPNR